IGRERIDETQRQNCRRPRAGEAENEDDQPDAEGAQREDSQTPIDEREKSHRPNPNPMAASFAIRAAVEPASVDRLRQERNRGWKCQRDNSSARRPRNSRQATSCASSTNSSGLCAWSIEPGPQTMVGRPARWKWPASVANETAIALLERVSLSASVSAAESASAAS